MGLLKRAIRVTVDIATTTSIGGTGIIDFFIGAIVVSAV